MPQRSLVAGVLAIFASTAAAEELVAPQGNQPNGVFDIIRAEMRSDPDRSTMLFRIEVKGTAGASRPQKLGRVAGAGMFAYLWPLSLDPATAGFAEDAGTLALALMRHPDFDDTPHDDENGNADPLDDGDDWHVHWLVLQAEPACGRGALKVGEFSADRPVPLPARRPDLPLLIGSPGYVALVSGHAVEVRVPVADLGDVAGARFDAWTASFRVDARLNPPLWCIVDVLDSASGDPKIPLARKSE